MLFLLLRLLPAIIPVLFFAAVKSSFNYVEEWQWFAVSVAVLPLFYFALLKYKNRGKSVFWLGSFALIFAATGVAYSMVLENPSVIDIFLVAWSLIYAVYLEAVFHDFYETSKTFLLNLLNITLYGNILIIFFLTATLTSFNIFLNLPWPALLSIAAIVYFCIIYLAFTRQRLSKEKALLYTCCIDLALMELLGALLLLPSSFYVIAIITALCYYLLTQLLLASAEQRLSRKLALEFIAFCSVIVLVVVATAAWL